MAEGVVPVQQRVIRRVGDDIIRPTLKFVFRYDNVQLISWCVKKIRCSTLVVEISRSSTS